MELPQVQYEVLARLGQRSAPINVTALASELGRDQSPVMAACTELRDHALLRIDEVAFDEFSLGKEGRHYAETPLPERTIVGVLLEQDGRCRLSEIPSYCDLDAGQVGQSLRWLNQRGWAKKEGDTLVLSAKGRQENDVKQPDELLLAALVGNRIARREELAAEGIDVDAALTLLVKRKGFIHSKPRTDRRVSITAEGHQLLTSGVTGRKKVTQLTPELLADGGWREVDLQPYDVTLAAKRVYPGKEHAFQRTLDKVRRVFLEMGFTEIISPWIESSFWDFDALFQPQDHPARDM
jgi:phenylalanyl-tRNA synthetase alpha chain